MAQTIWKYQLRWEPRQRIALPQGAKVLTVQMPNLTPVLWALVDPNGINVTHHTISALWTGQPISVDPGDYISTVQSLHGDLIWHFFIQKEI